MYFGGIYMHICVQACEQWMEVDTGCFSQFLTIFYFFKTRFHDSARMAGQGASGICLAPSSRDWREGLPSRLLMWVLGIKIQDLSCVTWTLPTTQTLAFISMDFMAKKTSFLLNDFQTFPKQICFLVFIFLYSWFEFICKVYQHLII